VVGRAGLAAGPGSPPAEGAGAGADAVVLASLPPATVGSVKVTPAVALRTPAVLVATA
jgi:hypothetical protein